MFKKICTCFCIAVCCLLVLVPPYSEAQFAPSQSLVLQAKSTKKHKKRKRTKPVKESKTLKMKMATRSGPSTHFTGLGTFPKNTEVKAIEKIKVNGTTWVLVEFTYKGELYRAYTGLKRLKISGKSIHTTQYTNKKATVVAETEVYLGPGANYKKYAEKLPANTAVTVVGVERGFAHVDYVFNGKIRRAYIDATKIQYQ